MDPTYDTGLDFDAQEQQLLQQAARIKALRGMDLTTRVNQPEGFQSAVTGAKFMAPTVKTPLLSDLTPILQDTRAGYDEQQLNQQRSQLTQSERADAIQKLQNFPKTQAAYFSSPDNTMHPAVEPSTSDIMAATVGLSDNPMTKGVVGPALDYQLTKAPGEALTRTMAAQERQRQQDNADRTYQESHNYHQAQLGKTNMTGFQPTGFSDKKGALIYANPSGLAYSANFPLDTTGAQTMPPEAMPPQMRQPAKPGQQITPSTGAIPFTAPQGGGAKTNPDLLPGAGVTETQMDQATRTKVDGIAASRDALKDFKNRRASLPPSIIADVAPTAVGKSKIAEFVDPDAPVRAGFYSDMQDFVNNKLYEASGKAINEQEMVRIKATMPNAASTDEEWDRWIDRTDKAMAVAATRAQELAKHKNYEYDSNLGAVVDSRTRRVIPGTESPFEGKSGAAVDRVQKQVEANVAKSGEPTGTFDPGTDPSKFDIKDPVQKAMAQRAFYNQQKGTKAPAPPALDASILKSADPARIAKARASGWSDAQIVQQLKSEAK